MPNLDFDAARRERLNQREPITFTLGGETFTCLRVIPFGVSWRLAEAPEMAELEGKSHIELIRVLAEMVADMLTPDDIDRWWALFQSKDEVIDSATMYEVVATLTEQFTARPTSPPTDSSVGRPSSGGRSSKPRTRQGSARSGT